MNKNTNITTQVVEELIEEFPAEEAATLMLLAARQQQGESLSLSRGAVPAALARATCGYEAYRRRLHGRCRRVPELSRIDRMRCDQLLDYAVQQRVVRLEGGQVSIEETAVEVEGKFEQLPSPERKAFEIAGRMVLTVNQSASDGIAIAYLNDFKKAQHLAHDQWDGSPSPASAA